MRLRLALLPVSCLCLAVSFPLLWGHAAAQGNPSVVGRWSPYPNLPFFPVHTHLLPTGKVAVWPGDGGVSGNDMHSWDPANGAIVRLSQPGYDVFCTGHVFLADGRLFVVGGHIQNGVGLPNASTYDAVNNLWTSVPPMNAGRWYPTATVWRGGSVTATWSGIFNSTSNDWIALYVPGAANNLYIEWMYVSCSKTPGQRGGLQVVSLCRALDLTDRHV